MQIALEIFLNTMVIVIFGNVHLLAVIAVLTFATLVAAG